MSGFDTSKIHVGLLERSRDCPFLSRAIKMAQAGYDWTESLEIVAFALSVENGRLVDELTKIIERSPGSWVVPPEPTP